MGETAIVTGAAGFIGSYLVKELVGHGYKVIAIVKKEHRAAFPNPPSITPIAADLSKPSAFPFKDVMSADLWFHLAWSGHAGVERSDIPMQLANVEMAANCVKTAKALGCRRFINAESLMVDELAYFMKNSINPPIGHIYGVAKQSANEMIKILTNDIGIEYVGGKISTYGVGEKSSRLIPTVLKNVAGNQPVFLTTGEQYYDFAYVTDVARAFRLIAEKGEPSKEYFIGSGLAKPLKEFMLDIQRITGGYADLRFGAVPLRSAMLPIETFDIAPLSRDCGYSPEISFDEGIGRCYSFIKTGAV